MGEIKFTKKDTVVYREKKQQPNGKHGENGTEYSSVCVGLVGEVIGVECSKGSFSLKKSKAFQLKW